MAALLKPPNCTISAPANSGPRKAMKRGALNEKAMPVWLPELFPTRSRATGIAFSFNAPRFIAFLGPLFAGALIVQFGGFSRAAMIISCIYVLGFCVAPFLPETKGRPLPA